MSDHEGETGGGTVETGSASQVLDKTALKQAMKEILEEFHVQTRKPITDASGAHCSKDDPHGAAAPSKSSDPSSK